MCISYTEFLWHIMKQNLLLNPSTSKHQIHCSCPPFFYHNLSMWHGWSVKKAIALLVIRWAHLGPRTRNQSWLAGQATFAQLYLNVIDTDICIISCFMFVECENDCCKHLNQWDPLLESSIKLHWSQFGKITPQRFFCMLKQVFFEKNCLKLDCIQILFETSAWEFFIILLLFLFHRKTFIFCM